MTLGGSGFRHHLVCQLWVVVLLREMTQEDIAKSVVEIVRQQRGTGLVALMPARRKNTMILSRSTRK